MFEIVSEKSGHFKKIENKSLNAYFYKTIKSLLFNLKRDLPSKKNFQSKNWQN
ncbi:hypothetical protein PSOL_05430 [Candidatus Phytoplasma solani]